MGSDDQVGCRAASAEASQPQAAVWHGDLRRAARPASTYAVMFKVHFWDDFARRQLARLQSVVSSGDIYILIDETSGSAGEVDFENVLHLTEDDCLAAGLADARTGASLLWYNIDYPHYLFFERFPKYDFYVSFEYDAVTTCQMDVLVDKMREGGIDYLGLPLRKSIDDWPWIESHFLVYKREDIRLALSCLAIFSRRAMKLLRDRRLSMAAGFISGELPFWPNNEAFIPTEIGLAGLKAASIADYGKADAFDWWPPSFELDVTATPPDRFLHPVLDEARYIKSLAHHWPNTLSLLRPNSELIKRLQRFPAQTYWPVLVRELNERVSDRINDKLVKLGLRRSWLVSAEFGSESGCSAPRTHAGYEPPGKIQTERSQIESLPEASVERAARRRSGSGGNVWPAPFASGFLRFELTSLHQRIRSRSMAPAKMEIRAPWSS